MHLSRQRMALFRTFRHQALMQRLLGFTGLLTEGSKIVIVCTPTDIFNLSAKMKQNRTIKSSQSFKLSKLVFLEVENWNKCLGSVSLVTVLWVSLSASPSNNFSQFLPKCPDSTLFTLLGH